MWKSIGARITSAHAIAVLALFISLTGTTFAAAEALAPNSVGTKQLKKNAVTGAKIKGNAVTGAKVAGNTVTGADVNESSLGKVPSAASADSATTATNATNATNAANAQTLGGASLESLTIGRGTASTASGGVSSSCDPSANAFVDCGNVALMLPRAGRVLIVADANFDAAGAFGDRGDCQLVVDGTKIGSLLSVGSVQSGASISGPGFNSNGAVGSGLNAVTDVLPAGAHTFALQCKEAGGSIEFPYTYVSAVMIGSS